MSPEANTHLESAGVGRLVGRDGGELLDGNVRRSEVCIGEVGRLELGQRLLIETRLELLEDMGEFWRKWGRINLLRPSICENCNLRTAVTEPGSAPRRNGAADTAMGATAAAKKDTVERRMFCQVQRRKSIAKKWISLLSA